MPPYTMYIAQVKRFLRLPWQKFNFVLFSFCIHRQVVLFIVLTVYSANGNEPEYVCAQLYKC